MNQIDKNMYVCSLNTGIWRAFLIPAVTVYLVMEGKPRRKPEIYRRGQSNIFPTS